MSSKNSKRAAPQWKRKVINSAIALAFSGMIAAPAWSVEEAPACPDSITGAQGGCVATSSTQTINITRNGVVSDTDTGIYYPGMGSTGSLTNRGRISAATSSGNWAAGVYVDGSLDGTLTNHGTIEAMASTSEYWGATAYGVYIGGDLAGSSLINSGTISATATASYATAYGVFVGDNLSGKLTNSGTIEATATTTDSDALAYGVYVDDDLSGTLTNSGTISATATTASTSGEPIIAYGVYIGGDLEGTLTNSGTISATADGSYASAYGVYVDDDLSGTLTNSGTIEATATASYATAYGVRVSSSLSGTLTNSGTIEATATATNNSDSPYAYGIWVSDGLSGTLTNSGTISATATADSATAYAYGIRVSGGEGSTLSGTLINSGTISASATVGGADSDDANARGVYVSGDLSGTLTNNGTITASGETEGTSSGVDAYAWGIQVTGDLSGTLNNNNTINATAVARDNAVAYGIQVEGDLSGTLNNSGTIRATAESTYSSNAYAYGVRALNLSGELNNSGTIIGTVADQPGRGYSLYLESGGAETVNNLAGGLLSGNVFVNGPAVNNAGAIFVPAGASGYINGVYTHQSGGVLAFGAASTDSYGQLELDDVANIPAGSTIAIRPTVGHTLEVDDFLNNVLNVSSSRHGEGFKLGGAGESGDSVTISSALVSFAGVIDDNSNVDVTVTAVNTLSDVLGSLGNASLSSIGATLEGLVAGYTGAGEIDSLLDELYGAASAAELGNFVSQLLPLMTGGMNLSTIDALHGISRIIQARQDANLGLSSGDTFYGNRAVWLKPFGSWADQDKRHGVPGYEADTYGMVFGVDGELSNTARIGAAFTYAETDVDGDAARQNADIKTYQLSFYGSHSLDAVTNFHWQADWATHDNEGRRVITLLGGGVAKSDYDSRSAHLGLGLGRAYKMSPQTTLTPSVRLDYTRVRADSYTETGTPAPLLLNVASDTTSELVLGVDAKLSHALSDSITVSANIGGGYDAKAERGSVTSTLAGGGAAFATRGIEPSDWLVRGGLGIATRTAAGVEISARYDIEGRSDFDNQTASIKVRVPF